MIIFDKANVLVVDDDQDLSEFIVELLMKEGYKVSAVTNINDSIYKLKNDIFDIVLLDLKLPEIDGSQGITKIKNVSPHSKVIVLTGYPTVETAVSTMKNGAIDYLKKPFKNEQLLEIIWKHINLESKNDIIVNMGEKIRSIRKGKGLKIRQLSARSGMTDSSISMIENAKISPSMTTLNKIAMALSVHPIEFFEIEKHKKWNVTRKGERQKIKFDNSDNTLEYLIKEGRCNRNEIFISHLGPIQKSFDEPITHKGYKFGYVLVGSIEVELENEEVHLHQGDSIFFESIIPHLWKSAKNQKSSSLWVITRE